MFVVKCNGCNALTPKTERTCRACKQPLAGSVHDLEDFNDAPRKPAPPSAPEPEEHSSLYEQLGPPWWLVAATAGLLLLYLDKNGTSPIVGILIALLALGLIVVGAFFAYACLGKGTTKNMSYGTAIVVMLLISGMLAECSGGGGESGCYEGGRYGEYSTCD